MDLYIISSAVNAGRLDTDILELVGPRQDGPRQDGPRLDGPSRRVRVAKKTKPSKKERQAKPARAVVGGVEHVVGGWSQHAINSRFWRARSDPSSRPGALYSGRTYVYAEDAVNSISAETWARPGILKAAIERLAAELGRLEDKLCEPDADDVWECRAPLAGPSTGAVIVVPPLTSADLREAAADPQLGTDPEMMQELSEAVLEVAASVGTVLPAMPRMAGLPGFPDEPVAVADDEAVLRLESSVAKHLATLEEYQAVLAERIGAAADAIQRAKIKPGPA